jgi:uncharacterized protein (DUF433 family)
MNEKMLIRRIEINPDIMLGKAVIKGTRLPVELIVEKIAYGATIGEILRQYPFVEENDIRAALLYAAKVLKREEVYPV